ncbi:hypothetical protein FQZ97_731950 [compost metagenome]
MPIDRIGHFRSTRVSLKVASPLRRSMRRMNIDSRPDRKIAVPLADTRSNLYTAGIAVGVATIGAAFITSWSRCGMANMNTQFSSAPPGANIALNGFRVQRVTSTVRIRNGDQALRICPRL